MVRPLQDQRVSKIPTTVTFECEISKSNLDVQWFKGETQIQKTKKYNIESRGKVYRLIINDVDDEDDAEYSIKIKSLQSRANLFVEGAFHISISSASAHLFPKFTLLNQFSVCTDS